MLRSGSQFSSRNTTLMSLLRKNCLSRETLCSLALRPILSWTLPKRYGQVGARRGRKAVNGSNAQNLSDFRKKGRCLKMAQENKVCLTTVSQSEPLTAKLLSATTTKKRPGNQRRTYKSIWRALSRGRIPIRELFCYYLPDSLIKLDADTCAERQCGVNAEIVDTDGFFRMACKKICVHLHFSASKNQTVGWLVLLRTLKNKLHLDKMTKL